MMFQRYYKAAYIIVDSGCPLSLVGKAIVENHIKYLSLEIIIIIVEK